MKISEIAICFLLLLQTISCRDANHATETFRSDEIEDFISVDLSDFSFNGFSIDTVSLDMIKANPGRFTLTDKGYSFFWGDVRSGEIEDLRFWSNVGWVLHASSSDVRFFLRGSPILSGKIVPDDVDAVLGAPSWIYAQIMPPGKAVEDIGCYYEGMICHYDLADSQIVFSYSRDADEYVSLNSVELGPRDWIHYQTPYIGGKRWKVGDPRLYIDATRGGYDTSRRVGSKRNASEAQSGSALKNQQ